MIKLRVKFTQLQRNNIKNKKQGKKKATHNRVAFLIIHVALKYLSK